MSNETVRYQAHVTDGAANSSYLIVADLVQRHAGAQRSILEVGCSSGYMGKFLQEKGHRVVGVEPNATAARQAAEVLAEVYTGGFGDFVAQLDPGHRFDVVMFGDVLEHLDDPAAALQQAATLLAEQGLIAVSIPNVTHGAIRALLLEGRWAYQDLGILDRTHLRFFSRRSFVEMCSSAGFEIVELKRTTMSVPDVNKLFTLGLGADSIAVAQAFSHDLDLQTFQFVGALRPCVPSDQASSRNQRWIEADLGSFGRVRGPWARARDRLRTKASALWELMNR